VPKVDVIEFEPGTETDVGLVISLVGNSTDDEDDEDKVSAMTALLV
jgi:hypothetical protein